MDSVFNFFHVCEDIADKISRDVHKPLQIKMHYELLSQFLLEEGGSGRGDSEEDI